MDWGVTAMITFSCVAANHLGLITAVEQVIKRRLPIINCPKCFTFWSVLAYGFIDCDSCFVVVAVAFLSSYLALWLNLLLGLLDLLYYKAYDTIYPTKDTNTVGT